MNLSVLEGMISDGRISNAQRVFNQIKPNLPIQVRILAAEAINQKIKEAVERRKQKAAEDKMELVLNARARWNSLFREV